MKILALLSVFLALPIAAQTDQGPSNTPQLNSTVFVDTLKGPQFYLTVQSALTKFCPSGKILVDIQPAATPGDAPMLGGQPSYTINGCANVVIRDDRGTTGSVCYAYSNSTTYVQGACSSSASSGFNLPAALAASPYCITTGNAGQLLTPDSSNNGQIDCVPTVVVSPSTITGSALGHVLWSLNVGGGGTLYLNNTSGTNEIAIAGSSGIGTFKNVAAGGTSAFINPSAAYAFGSSGLGNANVGFTQYVNSTSGEIDVATPSTGALGTRTITLPVPVGSTATFCYNDGTGCPSSAAGITVGTTTITGGNSGCLLYDSGGLLNCTSLVNNGVYTTSNTGAPVASTTLPGSLSINTGGVSFLNATSGFIKITPPTGALGSQTLTLPDTSSTLCAGDGTGCPSSFPSTSITPGTTTIIGASAPCAITNTTSTTMGCNGFTGTGLIVRTQSPTIDTLGVSTQLNVTAGSNLFAISSAGVAIGGNSTVNVVALGNATSGGNFNSTPVAQCGNTWNGAAAIADCWTWQDVVGTGSNPTSTYTLTHSGSSGTSRLSLPATILANLSTATTQSPGDNSTKVATTAYVDTALGTGTIENQIPKGTGTGLTESSLSDDGTTVTTSEVFKAGSSPVSNNNTTVPTTADVTTALAGYATIAGTPKYFYANIQGVTYATATMLGPVYYAPASGTINVLLARLSGSISCAVAPDLRLMDLGTSPGTVYLSAALVTNVSTGTSDGVYTNGLSQGGVITAGHYYGFASASGTCITAPAFDITVQY